MTGIVDKQFIEKLGWTHTGKGILPGEIPDVMGPVQCFKLKRESKDVWIDGVETSWTLYALERKYSTVKVFRKEKGGFEGGERTFVVFSGRLDTAEDFKLLMRLLHIPIYGE